ncbi:MAG: hypothetical protein KTR27_09640 [Leptolyngbyaceae cyanobacterium MAG.088]|nr:hypothetical protein [Leptolyngbyaceae cyanobacterium MAG.088]
MTAILVCGSALTAALAQPTQQKRAETVPSPSNIFPQLERQEDAHITPGQQTVQVLEYRRSIKHQSSAEQTNNYFRKIAPSVKESIEYQHQKYLVPNKGVAPQT